MNVKRITYFRAFEEERLFDMESVRSASLKMLYAWRIFKKREHKNSLTAPYLILLVANFFFISNKLIPTEKNMKTERRHKDSAVHTGVHFFGFAL